MNKILRLLLIGFVVCIAACADSTHEAAEQAGSNQIAEPPMMGVQDLATAPLPDQYTARVPITSRSDEARDAAFQTGLRQVYMQLTGHANVDSYDALKASIANASSAVEQYQYQTSGNNAYMLIHYHQTVVNDALKEADLSVYVEAAPGASPDQAGPKDVWLVITDLNDLDAYLRVDAYLNTLQGVSNVQTTELHIPNVTFQLTLNEPLDHLTQKLNDGEFLEHADHDDDMTQPITLYYRYNTP